MKSYLINLASATERLARMASIFDDLGISFERFDAVDGQRARVHPIFARMPPPKYRDWSDGELGCLLSHYEVWRLIADGSDTAGAVFEDDLHVSLLLRDVLATPMAAQADIIKLETTWSTAYRTARTATIGEIGLHRLAYMHYGSGAYLVTREAAKTLVSRVRYFDVPVDHILFEPLHRANRGLALLQCVPAPVAQDVAMPAGQRQGEYLESGMTDRGTSMKKRPLLERISRFPRSGARRIDKLLHPTTGGTVPFAGDSR